jgi:hypothetical protein
MTDIDKLRADLKETERRLMLTLEDIEYMEGEVGLRRSDQRFYQKQITDLRFAILSAVHGVDLFAGAEVVMTEAIRERALTDDPQAAIGTEWCIEAIHESFDVMEIKPLEGRARGYFNGMPPALVADARRTWLKQQEDSNG